MKGHIRERSPGHWAIILDAADPQTGKRKRRWHSFQGTKRQAQIECARLISAIQGGTHLEPNKITLAAFLSRWLDHIKSQVSPKSHERYAGIVNQNIIPALGAVLLAKLKPAHVSAAYSEALTSGRKDDRAGGLSPRTVGHMHRVLKQALGQAVRWELLTRNPADAVDPPKVERSEIKVWDIPTTATVLELVRPWRVHIPVVLAALCALRRGEVAALRWRHVDLDRAQLAVVESAEQTRAGIRYKTPKNGKSRTLALPVIVIAELRAWRLRQSEELLRLGIRLTDDTFVCAREDGSPIQPNSIGHAWDRFIASTDLPRIRFHDLRHGHATALLANGVHPKVASERLGHSRVALTLDTYSHVIPGMQEDAVARIDAAFGSALMKPRG
jgi:integrase